MADATYDVVIVGAGTKALTLGLYLNKYGGMKVAMFERHDESGGGMAGEEGSVPGFITPRHALAMSGDFYWETVFRDFPDEAKEFDLDAGAPRVYPYGYIFEEDQKCLVFTNSKVDTTQERTAAQVARFSQKDADTWLRLYSKADKILLAHKKRVFNPPPTNPFEPSPVGLLYRDPEMEMDPGWLGCSTWEVACEVFESNEVRLAFTRLLTCGGIDIFERGTAIPPALVIASGMRSNHFPRGTIHHNAHALIKMNMAMGNKIFAMSEVDKVVIENGVAKGIRLVDGSEIAARQMVVTNVDPTTLAFRFIGREKLPEKVVRKIERLQKNYIIITWYSWALHNAPKYQAAAWDPTIDDCSWLTLGTKNIDDFRARDLCRQMGYLPVDGDGNTRLQLYIANPFAGGSTGLGLTAPDGKMWCLTEQYVWPANQPGWDDKRWLKFKKQHAEDVVRTWAKFSTNMNWDNVIGYDPETPWDIAQHLANMAPEGCIHNIDACMSQVGPNRPIPEWSQYKVPEIKNLYCTGSGWHPAGYAWSFEAYNCYKIIAKDLGLRKPWEELGAPY